MDKTRKESWLWMAQHMPRVVDTLKRERAKGRGDVINECWRRGVLLGEPGFFYARENSVAVGTPSVELLKDPTMKELLRMFPNAALLFLQGHQLTLSEPPLEHPGPPLPETRHYNATQRRTQEAYGKD